MNDLVCYEFPLNERIRLFMRLEQLFQQLDYFARGNTLWESRVAISTLMEILAIFNRYDLKSEILKEADRHLNVLNKMVGKQHIDADKLNAILAKLGKMSEELYAIPGKIGLGLLEQEMFKAISQRTATAGGTCSFDLPAYHYWLAWDAARRQQDLGLWGQPFQPIRSAIDLLLNFIRHSAAPTEETALGGVFQKNLERNLPFQLLRVGLAKALPYYAEISGGKQRFTVRFMQHREGDRPVQTEEEVRFSLACCLF